MLTKLEEAKTTLDWYHEQKKDGDEQVMKLARNYFEWISTKTKLIHNESGFSVPSTVEIRRGTVFWVDFGYNIGNEFGGMHPAIVLRYSSGVAFVVPLGSGEPTNEQKQSGIYVKIPKVWTNLDDEHRRHGKKEFPNMTRWVNILNAVPVSALRFRFDWANGNVKGKILDKINEAMEQHSPWVRI